MTMLGVLLWVGIFAVFWAGFLGLRKHRRKSRATKTAQQVWDETDPKYRKGSWWQWPSGGGGMGSPPAGGS